MTDLAIDALPPPLPRISLYRVLLVQVRELRKVLAKEAALAPNPYLKVTLSGCSHAEKWRGVGGKQTKQSQAYGKLLRR